MVLILFTGQMWHNCYFPPIIMYPLSVSSFHNALCVLSNLFFTVLILMVVCRIGFSVENVVSSCQRPASSKSTENRSRKWARENMHAQNSTCRVIIIQKKIAVKAPTAFPSTDQLMNRETDPPVCVCYRSVSTSHLLKVFVRLCHSPISEHTRGCCCWDTKETFIISASYWQ